MTENSTQKLSTEKTKLFRFHRGSLDESMGTKREIKSLEDLKEIIEKEYQQPFGLKVESHYCTFDARIGWDTYYVLVTFENGHKFGHDGSVLIGMSNGTF